MFNRIQVRLFDGKNVTNNNKSPTSVWYDDGSAADAAPVTAAEDQSPVRPPRRRCKPVIVPAIGTPKRSHSLTAGITPISAEIKSILKKPASLTTDDLSPVRARSPVSPYAESTAAAAAAACNGLQQKKAKKQVQFDIVSTAAEEPATVDRPPEINVVKAEMPRSGVENTSSSSAIASHRPQDRRSSPTRKSNNNPYTVYYIG